VEESAPAAGANLCIATMGESKDRAWENFTAGHDRTMDYVRFWAAKNIDRSLKYDRSPLSRELHFPKGVVNTLRQLRQG
jgi:hypothetical protein